MTQQAGQTEPLPGVKSHPARPHADWIDFAKACAMFLVVLGHCTLIPRYDRAVIYTFHVPAFLFLSGAVLSRHLGQIPYGTFLRQKILPLVRLYGFFSACSVAIFAVGLIWSGLDWVTPVTASVTALLNGVHGPTNAFGHMNAPLWYFPFLVVSLCAMRLAASLPFAVGGLLMAALAWLGLHSADTIYPWYLNFAGIGGLFIWAGWAVAVHGPAVAARLRDKTVVTVLLLAAVIVGMMLLPEWRVRPNINNAEFGPSGRLYFTAAFTGIAMLCLLGRLVPATAAIRLLSQHTTVIFCIHIYLLRGAENMLGYDHKSLKMAILLAAIVTVVSLGLSVLIMPALRRYVIRPGAPQPKA